MLAVCISGIILTPFPCLKLMQKATLTGSKYFPTSIITLNVQHSELNINPSSLQDFKTYSLHLNLPSIPLFAKSNKKQLSPFFYANLKTSAVPELTHPIYSVLPPMQCKQ